VSGARFPDVSRVSAAAVRLTLLSLILTLSACATPWGGAGGSTSAIANTSPIPDSAEEPEVRRRARIRVELAASYYQRGNYTVALQELQQAIKIDSDYVAAYGMLGLVSMDLGNREQADASFRKALQLDPNDSDVNNNYGWFLCQTGKPRESIEYFIRAVRNPLYRTPAMPYHNAGICSFKFGDEKSGEDYLLRSFQTDPRNAVALYNLSEFYLKKRNLERAQIFSDRLIQGFEPNAQTLWLALRVERAAGNRDAEASLGTQLKRRFPTSVEAARLARGDYGD
jgi:type IV pilus assembly protein PilF